MAAAPPISSSAVSAGSTSLLNPQSPSWSVSEFLRQKNPDRKELRVFLQRYLNIQCRGDVAQFTNTFDRAIDIALSQKDAESLKVFLDVGIDFNRENSIFMRLLQGSFKGLDELIDLALQRGARASHGATQDYLRTLRWNPPTHFTLSNFKRIADQEMGLDKSKFLAQLRIILFSMRDENPEAVYDQMTASLLKSLLPDVDFEQAPSPGLLLDATHDPIELIKNQRPIVLDPVPPQALWKKYGANEKEAFDHLLHLIEAGKTNLLIDPSIQGVFIDNLKILATRPLGRSIILSLVECHRPIFIASHYASGVVKPSPGHRHIQLDWNPNPRDKGVVVKHGVKAPQIFEQYITLAHEFIHLLLIIKDFQLAVKLTETPALNPDYSDFNEEFTIACENILRAQFGLPERYGHLGYEQLLQRQKEAKL